MRAWEAIQTAVDYIEAHPNDSISTETLAQRAALSPFYFQRLFTRLVGRPVGEYTRLRRMERAAGLLAARGKVVDAALAAGFESHEGFTRAFKAAYGLTPEAYRRNPVQLNHFEKPNLALRYTMVDEGVPLLAEGMVLEICPKLLEEPRVFLGISDTMAIQHNIPPGKSTGVDSPGNVWENFHSRRKSMQGLLPGGEEWGFSYFGDAPEGCFCYFAGAEARPGTRPGPGEAEKRLEPGSYITVLVEAESREILVTRALNAALGYLFGTWLPGRGLTTQPFSAERYLPPKDGAHRLELWVQPLPAGK